MRRYAFALVLILFAMARGFSAPPAGALPETMDEKRLIGLLSDGETHLLLLDVRTREEYDAGHIPGALLFPYDEMRQKFREADKARPIVVYCRSGRRSAIAKSTLEAMGYVNVSDFGAYTKWRGKLDR